MVKCKGEATQDLRGKRVAESSGERQRNCFVPMGVDAQRQCLAVIGAAKEKHGNAQEYNELQWLGLVWQRTAKARNE